MLTSHYFVRLSLLCFCCFANSGVFAFELNEKLTKTDAVLITKSNGESIFEWQVDKQLIPASLTKLITAHLAIEKWGLTHRFRTEFYLDSHTLWVKGYGDPYLVSEELDLIAIELLKKTSAEKIRELAIDNSYFDVRNVPGRSSVSDPYNAPVSAVAANFNTVSLRRQAGEIASAEPQTPLTSTALIQANKSNKRFGDAAERINLANADNAQRHFAELLAIKLGLPQPVLRINQSLPNSAKLLYTHSNSHTVKDVLRGSLKYSNNFIANQVFLKLSDDGKSFAQASQAAQQKLRESFEWQDFMLFDGSGLSRKNRLSAQQINTVLSTLARHRTLLKSYDIGNKHGATVYAKTGTLDGVRSFAGFIKIHDVDYQFVFIFNRTVDWRYRETLLERVISGLVK